ncbi:MAG: hypothetical protein BWY95_02765 [Bacteroidetes bacterium ADurb.BinA104]|nr:MAG: hypothetical protein BWY95_02765 [Bacteroidetes bacterium ADurb.BinA104]
MATIYTEYESENGIRLQNMTGAAVIENQFVVMGGKCLKATEAIAPFAVGGFEKLAGKKVQADALAAGECAWVTGELPVYWNPSTEEFSNNATIGYYLVGYTTEAKTGASITFNVVDPVIVASDVATLQGIVEGITAKSGVWFKRTATLTSAAAGTAVHVLTDADVGSKTAYIMGAILKVDGATAWTDDNAAIVKIQDTNGTPVVGLTYAKAQLTGNAVLVLGSTGVTIGDAVAEGSGFTAAKGLDIIADANFAAGDNIKITIFGYLA